MPYFSYIEDNAFTVLWMVLGLILVVASIPLIKKIRNRRLLKTVTALNRGTQSERELVLQLLKKGIPAQTIFHDLCLERNNGKFAQIDVVLATTQGIVVFEVKDYSGWIYGNGNYSLWTKVLAYGKEKYQFYNPIKQNLNHIKALRKQLKQFEDIPFFSILVFYGNCKLKEINYVPSGTFLVKPHRLKEVLNRISKNNPPAPYTNKREVIDLLKKAVENGKSINKQEKHIENIKDLLGKDRIYD